LFIATERTGTANSNSAEFSMEESMGTLVERLCGREHAVEVSLRSERTVEALRRCIERGYVHVKFTETQGGTELGMRLDEKSTNLQKADFEKGVGQVILVGSLKLDYVKVRCIVDIDLESLEGKGRLEITSQ
jgi:hypothetical protein